MATYAIGDVQGCFDTLQALLAKIRFDPAKDRVWLAGDLVNRGPKSAEVLRWCIDHEATLRVVLGNHDLHLLAASEGLRKPKGRDTMQDVLRAPDRARLLDFLWRQPFLQEAPGYLMVHAGWPPRWTEDELKARARALASGLQGPSRREVLAAIAGVRDDRPHVASYAAALTRMRTVDASGRPVYEFAGPPELCPRGEVPWYAASPRVQRDQTVLFGHWAALGHRFLPKAVALDSGCVWGERLTAVRLADLRVFQVEALE